MWIDRRWLVLGVGASLLLNVFFVGIIAGHTFGWHGGPVVARLAGGALVPRRHVRALPIDQRKLFTAGMEPHRAAIRASHQEQLRLRAAAEADIVAEPFDRAKVAAAFKALRDANIANQEQVQNGLLDALQSISQASRAALVSHDVEPLRQAPAAH